MCVVFVCHCVCEHMCVYIHIDVVLFLMVHVQPFNESLHVGKVRHVACCHYQYMKVKIMAIGTFRGGGHTHLKISFPLSSQSYSQYSLQLDCSAP